MSPATSSLLVLVDHKNLSSSPVRPSDILSRWLVDNPESAAHGPVIDIHIRTYGGWFQETLPTEERASAIGYYQAHLPTLFQVRNRYYRTHLNFADALLISDLFHGDSPSISLTHTTVLRPAELASTVRADTPPCVLTTCRIAEARRWIRRRRACLDPQCPYSYSEYFERREQKQIDVHIGVDLLLATRLNHPVALITADNDLVPAIVAYLLARQSQTLTWFRPKPSAKYLDTTLASLGLKIIDL